MNTVGVISFQGDFERHMMRCEELGTVPIPVRDLDSLKSCDALIIPGGESTTIGMLLERFDLIPAISDLVDAGLPVFGTCAGAILLANKILGPSQPSIGGLAATVRRNAYGRQVESFEAELIATVHAPWSEPVLGVFIRAPIIEECSPSVTSLLTFESNPVLVRQESILAATFHPELTQDRCVHEYFLREVAGLKLSVS